MATQRTTQSGAEGERHLTFLLLSSVRRGAAGL
jgi:hypothetical protein